MRRSPRSAWPEILGLGLVALALEVWSGRALLAVLAQVPFREAVLQVAAGGLLGGLAVAVLGYPVALAFAWRSTPPPVARPATPPPVAALAWQGMKRFVAFLALAVLARNLGMLRVLPPALVGGMALLSVGRSARQWGGAPAALRCLGADGRTLVLRVLVPFSLPALLDGLRLGVSWLLVVAMGAGLHALAVPGRGVPPPAFMAVAGLFLALGLLWNVSLAFLFRRLAPWAVP